MPGDTLKTVAGIALNADAVGEVLGVNRATIYEWTRKGLPKESRGRYLLVDVVRWALERDEASGDVKALREDLLREQTIGQRLKNAKMRGDLIPRSEFDDTARELGALITEVLDLVPQWHDDPGVRAELKQRADDHRRSLERRIRDRASARHGGVDDREPADAGRERVGHGEPDASRGH